MMHMHKQCMTNSNFSVPLGFPHRAPRICHSQTFRSPTEFRSNHLGCTMHLYFRHSLKQEEVKLELGIASLSSGHSQVVAMPTDFLYLLRRRIVRSDFDVQRLFDAVSESGLRLMLVLVCVQVRTHNPSFRPCTIFSYSYHSCSCCFEIRCLAYSYAQSVTNSVRVLKWDQEVND